MGRIQRAVMKAHLEAGENIGWTSAQARRAAILTNARTDGGLAGRDFRAGSRNISGALR